MDVLIVGAGAMGRWFGGTIVAEVTYADVDQTAARTAASDQEAESVSLDTAERFDAVVLAVPMAETATAIEAHASKATDAVLDLAGEMRGPTEAMGNAAPDLDHVSLHPLFAPENAPGRIAVVREEMGETAAALLSDLEAAGNELIDTTPAEHDRAMETIQARAHAAILAFGLAAEEVPPGFGTPVYDGLQDLLLEVTGGSARVYADIQETFDGAASVAEAAGQIAAADRTEFERLYRAAGAGVSEE